MIVSLIWSSLFGARAYLRVMVNEEVDLSAAPWTYEERGLFSGSLRPSFRFLLEGFELKESPGGKRIRSKVLVGGVEGVHSLVIESVRPEEFKGIKIYQLNEWGYVVEFLLRKKGEPHRRMFYFAEKRGGAPGFFARGRFLDTPYLLKFYFFPDISSPSSDELVLPGVRLVLLRDGEEEFDGEVYFSQRVRLSEGEFLYFSGISRWTGFVFVKKSGEGVLNAGLFFSVLGGAWLGLFYAFKSFRR